MKAAYCTHCGGLLEDHDDTGDKACVVCHSVFHPCTCGDPDCKAGSYDVADACKELDNLNLKARRLSDVKHRIDYAKSYIDSALNNLR